MAQNWVKSIVLIQFNTAAMAGTYTALNAGLEAAVFLLRIVNNSGNAVTISFDGTNDHEYIPANSSVQLSFETNALPNAQIALMKKGTIVYAKGTAGAGALTISGYYL